MAAFIQVKDNNGNIIDIPAFRGEKGEKGDSGVYIGSGNMPDGCNIRINPDGQESIFSLGIHTDGLVYLFINGEPAGNGISMAGGITGDVIGNVDSANNVILYGELPMGEYTIKYEMTDGSLVDIGILTLSSNETEEPTDRLPSEYQEVEWIQINNSGTYHCGIKTELLWSEVNKIVTKVQNIHSGEAKDIIFSTWDSETTKTSPFIRTYNSGNLFASANGLIGYVNTPEIANADTNANEFTMTWESASSDGTIFFGSYQDDAYSNPHKWYFVEFYNSDTLVGQFIPCYRKSDSIVGFYDTVGEKFYTNTHDEATDAIYWAKGNNV